MEKERVKHASHPNGSPHPFKALTLCKKMIRFGGFVKEGEEITCKLCKPIAETICPTCKGSGVK